MEGFIERLSQLMQERGVSNYKLAKEIGISPTTVANYLDGKTEPNNLISAMLAGYFNVSKQWLETGKTETNMEVETVVLGKKNRAVRSTGTYNEGSGENYRSLVLEVERLRSEVDRLQNELFQAQRKIIQLLETKSNGS